MSITDPHPKIRLFCKNETNAKICQSINKHDPIIDRNYSDLFDSQIASVTFTTISASESKHYLTAATNVPVILVGYTL